MIERHPCPYCQRSIGLLRRAGGIFVFSYHNGKDDSTCRGAYTAFQGDRSEEGDAITTNRYDVVAVSLATKAVSIIATDNDWDNAEAVVLMAVIRRGVEEEFFVAVPVGMYKEGDTWHGKEVQP